MALADMIIKARINMALVRTPRIHAANIGVMVEHGCVHLTGDLDEQDGCRLVEELARSVEGVRDVRNEVTCGINRTADTEQLVALRLQQKLDDAWHSLPAQDAVTEAEYLRWALWLIHKFRFPPYLPSDGLADAEAMARDNAIARVAAYVGAPKALLAYEMLQLTSGWSDPNGSHPLPTKPDSLP
jgi:hypothetical protein